MLLCTSHDVIWWRGFFEPVGRCSTNNFWCVLIVRKKKYPAYTDTKLWLTCIVPCQYGIDIAGQILYYNTPYFPLIPGLKFVTPTSNHLINCDSVLLVCKICKSAILFISVLLCAVIIKMNHEKKIDIHVYIQVWSLRLKLNGTSILGIFAFKNSYCVWISQFLTKEHNS